MIAANGFRSAVGYRAGPASAMPMSTLHPDAEIRIQLVESFEICLDGLAAAIPAGAQRLLAFLALHTGPVRRSFICGNLWPEENEEHAAARLRSALCRLRRVIDCTVLVQNDRLQLNPKVAVDVQEIAAAADRLADPGRMPQDIGPWFDELTRELLVDWYDEWVGIEREQYRQLRLHALESLCQGLTEARKFFLAVRAGLAAVAADPLRESAQRVLINAYLEEGNPSEAVHQYHRYWQALQDELGLSPTQRLEELVRPLLRRNRV